MNREELIVELENYFVEVNIDDERTSYCNSLDKNLVKAIYNLKEENKQLKEKIDKVIDKLTTEQLYINFTWGKSFYVELFKELLRILKGEENE